MERPLSQDSSHVPMEGSGYWSLPARAGRSGQVGSAGRVGLATHVRPPTLECHNFFIRTPFQVSWTLWKAHRVKIPAMCLWRAVGTEADQQGQVG